MEPIKNYQEMKEKNEEILKRWRELGFLNGLKEGSQNEWRCAKSFDLMANYLLEYNGVLLDLDVNTFNSISALYFSIIRRLICVERPRVNRIVQPEEIHKAFIETTLKETTDTLSKSGRLKKKKTSKRGEYILNIKEYYKLDDLTFVAALELLNNKTDLDMLRKVFDVDIETEMCVLFSKYMALKLNNERK